MSRLADPNCPRCRGEGHLFEDADSIVPVMGRTCECVLRAVERASILDRVEAASLPERYAEASFDAFGLRNETRLTVRDPDRGEVVVAQSQIDGANLARVRELAATPLRDETVAFTGPMGVGKTYLACALLLEQIRRHGKRGLYLTTYQYVRELMPEGAEPEAQRDLRTRARSADVLLLDDLGVEKSSAYAMRELWDLLHYRTSNGLATIVTSNLSIKDALLAKGDIGKLPATEREAAELGRRIFSRLAETRVAPISWPEGATDVRLGQQGAATRPGAIRDARRSLRRDLIEGSTLE